VVFVRKVPVLGRSVPFFGSTNHKPIIYPSSDPALVILLKKKARLHIMNSGLQLLTIAIPQNIYPMGASKTANKDDYCTTKSSIPLHVISGNAYSAKSPMSSLTMYTTFGRIECDSQNWIKRRSSSNHCP
jgi:hypothetical protein